MEVGLPGLPGIPVLSRVVEDCNIGFASAPILRLLTVGNIALDHREIFEFVTHSVARVSIRYCEKICMNFDDFLDKENFGKPPPAKNGRNIPLLKDMRYVLTK